MIEQNESSLWTNIFRRHDPWHMTVAELWAKTPLFSDIPKKEVLKLAKCMHPRQYASEETIFRANDVGAGAAIIIEGKIAIKTSDVTLVELGPGDFFGEVSLVLDERRTADAVAMSDSKLAFFLRLDLDEWISRSPHQGALLTKNLAHTLAKRLQHSNQIIAQNGK